MHELLGVLPPVPDWRRIALFSGIADTDFDHLKDYVEVVDAAANEVLYEQGRPGGALHVVLTGTVKLERRVGDRRTIMFIARPGDHFGELNVFDPGPSAVSATTRTRVRLVRIPGEVLQAWVFARPWVAETLLRSLAQRVKGTDERAAALVFDDVPARLARQLVVLGEQFGEPAGDAIRLSHGLTQDELGQLIGTSRETVNKALGKFIDRGWIRLTEGRGLTIRQPESLKVRARLTSGSAGAARG